MNIRWLPQRLRWYLGLPVAVPDLEKGTDESIARYYSGRVTDCGFVADPSHYEYPRVRWILGQIGGGRVLEVGCGNGGLTRLLAAQADEVTALDVSRPSLDELRALRLANVRVVEALVERFEPDAAYDWIVLTEVVEHLRDPRSVIARCARWLVPGGSVLVTTPNGHWESNEHLHEFGAVSLFAAMAGADAEQVSVGFLRDRDNRRRWLYARATAAVPVASATPE